MNVLRDDCSAENLDGLPARVCCHCAAAFASVTLLSLIFKCNANNFTPSSVLCTDVWPCYSSCIIIHTKLGLSFSLESKFVFSALNSKKHSSRPKGQGISSVSEAPRTFKTGKQNVRNLGPFFK